MSSGLGIHELIEQIRAELLRDDGNPEQAPLLSIDEVTLELHVSVQRTVSGGAKLVVLEAGTAVQQNDVQIVKVTLSTLLSREERRALYLKRFPEQARALVEQNMLLLRGDQSKDAADYGE